MTEFYNEVIKNKYLDEIENEGSRKTIHYIFVASKRAEEIKGMDLYNFSKEDIELVLGNMSMTSNHTARANTNYISNYITWCIKHGYRENNINPLDTVDRKWYSKFVDRTIKIHYTDEELEDLIEEFDNAQDQAMVQLWFEGAMGTKDFNEIKELNYYDINWNTNEIQLRDNDGSKRAIIVSNKCMRYIENAHKQRIYRTYRIKNGEIKEGERELFETNFIFKNVKSYVTKEAGISTSVIYTRLNSIKEKFNLHHFTPNAVKQSGMLYMAAELYKRDGELTTQQLREIGDKYNLAKITNNGIEYHNVTLMKMYINEKNLKELYDLDIEIDIKRTRKK